MTLTGTLRRVDVEGGVWQLVTDDGRRFQLLPAPQGAQDGARVEVDGEPRPQGLSFQMTAPTLEVRRLRRLS